MTSRAGTERDLVRIDEREKSSLQLLRQYKKQNSKLRTRVVVSEESGKKLGEKIKSLQLVVFKLNKQIRTLTAQAGKAYLALGKILAVYDSFSTLQLKSRMMSMVSKIDQSIKTSRIRR